MKIISAKYLDEYRIEVVFSNGEKRISNFENFIINAQHPDITKFKDISLFKKFKIEYGFISWLNGEMELDGDEIFYSFC